MTIEETLKAAVDQAMAEERHHLAAMLCFVLSARYGNFEKEMVDAMAPVSQEQNALNQCAPTDAVN